MSDLTNLVRDICEQYGHRIVAGLLLVMASVAFGIAQAATITATCTAPTQNTDGTAISGAISYTFHWGVSATALSNSLSSSTCNATIAVPDPAVGASQTYYVGVRAIVGGAQSALSNVVSVVKSTPRPTPNPPTGLRVVDPVAYRLDAGSHNRVAFTAIGSVPVDTACMTSYSVTIGSETKHMVTRTAATPVGSLPYQVWAKCQA